ncbi:hypothetical protein ES703_62575 [subsurface metagenome]
MQDCRKCKDYRGCPGKPWFHYGEIRYCPHQVCFIILSEALLSNGSWPANPDGTTSVDPKVRTGYKSEAYFVKSVGILAEVNYRLKRCGTDGKLLRAEVLAGLDLSQESKDALMYCKGNRRKSMSYQRWLRNRRYHGKKLTKMS